MGGLILLVGSLIGGTGGLIAFVIALAVNGYAYFNSDKLALRAMRAFPVTETQAPRLYRDRARAGAHRGPPAHAAALRQPDRRAQRLRHRPQPAPRRRLRHHRPPRAARPSASCAASSAHELSHVYNRDILISSVAGAMATMITYLAHMAMFASLFGGRATTTGRNALGVLLHRDPRPGRRRPRADGGQPVARVPGRRDRRRR